MAITKRSILKTVRQATALWCLSVQCRCEADRVLSFMQLVCPHRWGFRRSAIDSDGIRRKRCLVCGLDVPVKA